MRNKIKDNSWWIDSLFIILTIGCLFFFYLGARPLFVPDEGRYAEIAREMVASGDFVTPHLNGIKYFEKPVLFYWLAAGAMKLGGVTIFAVRSVNALLGLIGCLLTYFSIRKLYDRQTGLMAAYILGTCTLYFVMAHMVSLDLPVTVFLSASLYSFLLGVQSPFGNKRRAYLWLAAIAAGLAVLTKGLIGIVFPTAIIFLWLAILGEWGLLKKLYIPSSLLIFLLVVTPWHVIVAQRHPEFFYFYFIEQHFLRYTNPEVGHYQPIWYFIPILIIGFFPWIVFLAHAIARAFPVSWKKRAQNKLDLFFIIWLFFIFAFFSFSKSKLIPYILPLFPAAAILTARYLTQFSRKIFILTLIIGSISLMGLLMVAPSLDKRTILPLANSLKTFVKPQDEVITYNQYYQDLPFYLERRVSILNWKNELTYGMQHQNTSEWMIDDLVFKQRWRTKKWVYVIMSKDEYEFLKKKGTYTPIYIVNQTQNNILISNNPAFKKNTPP